MPKNRMRDGVVKRGNTWSYVIYVPDAKTGKKKNVWVSGFPNRAEAKAARIKALNDLQLNKLPIRTAMTVAEFCDLWLDEKRVSIKPKTYESYRQCIDYYIKPTLGEFALQKLSRASISAAYRDLMETGGRNRTGVSATTVRNTHKVVRAMLNSAVDDGLISVNPCARVTLPRAQDRKPRALTAEEVNRLLKIAANHRLYALFELAAHTGMRLGECLALRWSDISLDKKTITVKRSADSVLNPEGKYVRISGTTKSGKERTIQISDHLVAVLNKHKTKQEEDRLQAGDQWAGSPELFLNESGLPIHPDTPKGLMRRFRSKLGWDDRELGERPTFHWLRHTHATLLLLDGKPVQAVSVRLGHESPKITWETYSHVLPNTDADIADAFLHLLEEESTNEGDDEQPDAA